MTASTPTRGQWDVLRSACEIRQGDLVHASVNTRVYDSEILQPQPQPQHPLPFFPGVTDIHSSCLQEL
jgi:hypothetical protein